MKGTTTTALNMGSYNYLGFAQNEGPCADAVHEGTKYLGCGVSSARHEMGIFFLILTDLLLLVMSCDSHVYMFVRKYGYH